MREEAVGEVGLHEDWTIICDEFGEEVLRVSVAAYFIKSRRARKRSGALQSPAGGAV